MPVEESQRQELKEIQSEEAKWVKTIPGIPKDFFPYKYKGLCHIQQSTRRDTCCGQSHTQPRAVWEGEGGVIQQNLSGEQSLQP